jgi:oligopeptide/dipeptide ABC transporter ATP-binding protein
MRPDGASRTGTSAGIAGKALEMRGVTIGVETGRRTYRPLVSNVDLTIGLGESVGVVGESGSGKSVTALSCLGLLPDRLAVTEGEVFVAGNNIRELSPEQLRRIRGTEVAMIFQDPMTSLDPCFTVGSQIIEAIVAHQSCSKTEARKMAVEILDVVEIARPAERLKQYPHEFSGGMRQRVMIAAALVLRPKLLIADEPTTALDVTTQAAIIKLVRNLRSEFGMSVLWISHDLGVVADIADRVVVMYAGELVEDAATESIFERPTHPYTRGMIESSLHRPHGSPFGFVSGTVPEPADWPAGCRFAARCGRRIDRCAQHPELVQLDSGVWARCVNPEADVRVGDGVSA